MQCDMRFQNGDRLTMTRSSNEFCYPVFNGTRSEFVQPGDLRLGPCVVPEFVKGLTAPQVESPAEALEPINMLTVSGAGAVANEIKKMPDVDVRVQPVAA